MYIHSYMYFRRKDRTQFYNCNISCGTGYSIEAFYDFNDYPQACSQMRTEKLLEYFLNVHVPIQHICL